MSYKIYSDEYFMNEALKEAIKARDEQEIPVGAVIVADKQIIARAHNQTETLRDATAHAEMLAITAASNNFGNQIPECMHPVCNPGTMHHVCFCIQLESAWEDCFRSQ